MALNHYDHVELKRIFNEVLDERAREREFDIFTAIRSVQEACLPMMPREERLRMRFEEVMAPLDAHLEDLTAKIGVAPPSAELDQNDLADLFRLAQDYKRVRRAAEEQGIGAAAQRAQEQFTRISNFIGGDADTLRTNDSQE